MLLEQRFIGFSVRVNYQPWAKKSLKWTQLAFWLTVLEFLNISLKKLSFY